MNEQTKEMFLKAYDAHGEAIYRHCFFRVFSKERAEELTQETFMRTWEYLAKGEKIREDIRPLLYRIATNLIIDDSRKRKESSLDVLLEASDAHEPSYDGERSMEKQMLWKQLLEEVKTLQEDEREVLVMRYVDDLDPKEIAKILHISANHVSVKINRAVKSLSSKTNVAGSNNLDKQKTA
jgi:RNA polymerase sigma-70 factor (ECF subfamily)